MLSVSHAMESLTLQDLSLEVDGKFEREEKPIEGQKEEKAAGGEKTEAEKGQGEGEGEEEEEDSLLPTSPFPFFALPSELRLRVYSFVLFSASRRRRLLRTTGSVGASAKNPPIVPLQERLALFLVSKQVHTEASHFFYSMQTFRVFPIQDYSRLPTVRFLSPRYRQSISNVELVLGSSWTKPPKSWVVNNGLGLEDMHRVRTLKVFLECDPSHPVFEGFRISKGFYTEFAGDMLHKIIDRLPNLLNVEFDGYPSVRRYGSLMTRLLQETKAAKKRIIFGPQRQWREEGPANEEEAVVEATAH